MSEDQPTHSFGRIIMPIDAEKSTQTVHFYYDDVYHETREFPVANSSLWRRFTRWVVRLSNFGRNK